MLFGKSPEKILNQQSPSDAVFALIARLRKKRDFSKYTNAERMLWCLNVLNAEAENGTLEQYAANSSGDLYEETKNHLSLIGANAAVEVLDRLNELLNGNMTASRKDRVTAIEKARSVGDVEFETEIRKLTDRLDSTWDGICSKAVDYLRNHIDELT